MANKQIIIIDDDPVVRDLVKAILGQEGYKVLSAENGKKGVSLIEKKCPSEDLVAVIVDVVMPEMNGLDVVTRLKLHKETSSIPILMLTGEDKAEDIMKGYSVGADYYITKPFTREQLLFGLQMVLGTNWQEKD